MKNNEGQYKKKKVHMRALLFIGLWVIIIFALSSQPATASKGLSRKVTKVIFTTLQQIGLVNEKTEGSDLVNIFDHTVRKYAHFFNYMVLGVLMANIFKRIKGNISGLFVAFSICLLVACLDETYQFLIPGRGPEVKDVMIDSLGAMMGIVFYAIMAHFYRFLTER